MSHGVLAGGGEPHSCSERACFTIRNGARKPRLRRVLPFSVRLQTDHRHENPKYKGAFAKNLAPRKGLFSKRSPTLGRSRAGRSGGRPSPSLALTLTLTQTLTLTLTPVPNSAFVRRSHHEHSTEPNPNPNVSENKSSEQVCFVALSCARREKNKISSQTTIYRVFP